MVYLMPKNLSVSVVHSGIFQQTGKILRWFQWTQLECGTSHIVAAYYTLLFTFQRKLWSTQPTYIKLRTHIPILPGWVTQLQCWQHSSTLPISTLPISTLPISTLLQILLIGSAADWRVFTVVFRFKCESCDWSARGCLRDKLNKLVWNLILQK